MAKRTPEGKVKSQLLACLAEIKDCFYYMPVQNGMGQSGIPDVIAIIGGVAFGLECKATRKQKPTTLQAIQLERIANAKGYAWVVDAENVANVAETLMEFNCSRKLVALNDVDPSVMRWQEKLEVYDL